MQVSKISFTVAFGRTNAVDWSVRLVMVILSARRRRPQCTRHFEGETEMYKGTSSVSFEGQRSNEGNTQW